MDQYLGMILMFGGNFNPTNFQFCNGQLLAISSNAALFSLLGTYYGGNGTSTFSLPDLRGRAAVQQGQGVGVSDYVIGEFTGVATITLLSSNVPIHSHTMNAVTAIGGTASPSGAMLAEGPKRGSGPSAKSPDFYLSGSTPNVPLNIQSVGPNVNGGSNAFSIMQPYLAISYIIAMQGVFPTRN
jgi:microcystin-dependent protein